MGWIKLSFYPLCYVILRIEYLRKNVKINWIQWEGLGKKCVVKEVEWIINEWGLNINISDQYEKYIFRGFGPTEGMNEGQHVKQRGTKSYGWVGLMRYSEREK